MCIIVFKQAQIPMLPEETIKTCFQNNPDGAGLMWHTPGKEEVFYKKGFFKVESLLDFLQKNQKVLQNSEVVLHFRIGTSGKKDEFNCHPYPVFSKNEIQGKTIMGLAHNGVLDNYGYPGNTQINDTQVFVKECLRKLPHNFARNRAIMRLIRNGIGANKLAILSKEGANLIGDFIEDEIEGNKYIFSNSSYKPRVYTYTWPYYSPLTYSKKTEKDKQLSLFNVPDTSGKLTGKYQKDENPETPKVFRYRNLAEYKKHSAKVINKARYIKPGLYVSDKYMYELKPSSYEIKKSPRNI